MTTLYAREVNQKNGKLSRRGFLRAGSLCIGGLTLADILRLRANGSIADRAGNKAVIMIYLPGGPSHLDTYDLKPKAPVEYRGEFQPIPTSVPGLDICELLPLQAKLADKLAIVRNLKFGDGIHTGTKELETGSKRGDRPGIGSVVSRLQRDAGSTNLLPPYVAMKGNGRGYPAFLGAAHKPFVASDNLKTLALSRHMTPEILADRAGLLQAFDTIQRDIDRQQGDLAAHDTFTAQALEMITSERARYAFDISREPEPVRARYGSTGAGLLQARRLVEAGVKVVSLSFRGLERGERCGACAGPWDNHGDIFQCLRLILPRWDQAFSALIADLYARGLDKDVAVVAWGEFGRTPKVGKDTATKKKSPGRDHWPEAGFALLAGGGLDVGQVVGATDSRGGRPVGGAYSPQNVLATLYRVLGIDPRSTLPDHTGRPIHLLDTPEPIKELV